MAREETPSAAGLAHHYTHVAISLNESRKSMEVKTAANEVTANQLDHTIQGVCKLIDALVSQEHKNMAANTVKAS